MTLDAEQLDNSLPGCSQAALQNAATALAALGFEGAMHESLRYTDARELAPGHFAGVGAGLFARVHITRGTVLGMYGGAYTTSAEVEAEQAAELTADPPRVLAHLYDLDVADLVVNAITPQGARCWGGCVNASRRDVPPGAEGSVANVVFVRGMRGASMPGPLPGIRLPILFCVASRDVAAGAELLLDYGDAYWKCHDEQQRRVQAVQRGEDAKREAPARVAARAECACLKLGSGIIPDLCPQCNPVRVTTKNGRALRQRQQPAAQGAVNEASPPQKRPRRSLGPTLNASAPMDVEPASPGASTLVQAACDAVPSPTALLALHREMVASVVPAVLRNAADAASAAAECARKMSMLSDSVHNADTAALRARLLQAHGASLAADVERTSEAAAGAARPRQAARSWVRCRGGVRALSRRRAGGAASRVPPLRAAARGPCGVGAAVRCSGAPCRLFRGGCDTDTRGGAPEAGARPRRFRLACCSSGGGRRAHCERREGAVSGAAGVGKRCCNESAGGSQGGEGRAPWLRQLLLVTVFHTSVSATVKDV